MQRSAWFLLLVLMMALATARANDIDASASKITVRVYKSGLFSAFAHDHTISAPIASGQLDVEKRSVELKFRTENMQVLDPGAKDSERATIESTMKSDKVLDIAKFPEISFSSTQVDNNSTDHFLVHGSLALHGVTKPIDLPVTFSDGRYHGSVKLRQTDFGITPIRIAGGSVKVKDEIEIEFEIVASK